MSIITPRFASISGFLAMWLCFPSAPAAEAQKVDLSKFPGDFVDEVIVPVPSEIFGVLDKLGQPNWRSEMREQDNAMLTDRHELALQFGVVVADGFIAVQAEDKSMVQQLGREVLRLAKSLGVEESVKKHAQAIIDNADRNEFEAVREELDMTQFTVREEMRKLRDEDVAQCVSLGGWLRGTEVVTSVIGKSYSREKAELLYQPELVEHFRASIKEMRKDVRTAPKMKLINEGLEKTRTSMTSTVDGMITADAIHQINQVCAGLVAQIVNGKEAAPSAN